MLPTSEQLFMITHVSSFLSLYILSHLTAVNFFPIIIYINTLREVAVASWPVCLPAKMVICAQCPKEAGLLFLTGTTPGLTLVKMGTK